MSRAEHDGMAIKLSAAERWIATRPAAIGAGVRRWRQESWVAAIIKTAGILVVVVNAVFGVLEKKDDAVRWLGWDKCHMFDAVTGKPDQHLSKRPCLSGHVTFVKWLYPYQENASDVVDRPNRIFQVVSVNGGQVEWGEQKLLQFKDGKETWQPGPTQFYIALEGGEAVPSWELVNQGGLDYGANGFLLRRIDIVGPGCAAEPGREANAMQFSLPEFFIENTPARSAESDGKYVYMRTIVSSCGQEIGTAFRVGQDFGNNRYTLALTARDP